MPPDYRFPSPGSDMRFPSPGTDIEFTGDGSDARHPSPGVDTRFEGNYGVPPVPAPPLNTQAPQIPTNPIQGVPIFCDGGFWSGYPRPSLGYQWYRAPSTLIAGAITASYTPGAIDVGFGLFCRVSATNSEGGPVVADSNTSANVSAALFPPSNTVAPSISGTPAVGSILSGNQGTWTGNPAPSYTNEWLRNGGVISGAGGTGYMLQAADEGAMISFRVTGTNSQGSNAATSAAVGPIEAQSGTEPDLNTYLILHYGQSLSIGTSPVNLADIKSIGTAVNITNATQANPIAITATNTFANDDVVFIKGVGGMTQLNYRSFKVAGASGTGFTLKYLDGVAVDGTSGFSAYTSGGTAAVPLRSSTHKMLNGGVRAHQNHRLNNAGSTYETWLYGPTQASALVDLQEWAPSTTYTELGETFAYGTGLQITPRTIMASLGRGSMTAEQLTLDNASHGIYHMNNVVTAAKQMYELGVTAGYTISNKVVVIFKQGEAEASTAKAAWKASVEEIQDDIEAGMRHVVQATPTVYFVMDQIAYNAAGNNNYLTALGALELHKQGTGIYCAGPTYWCDFENVTDVHFAQVMYRKYGEHLGRVSQQLISTGNWKPCYITAVSRNTTTISVTVYVPEGNLVVDTARVTDPGNYGFVYSGATITNVSVGATAANTATITITINASAGGTLQYAYRNGMDARNGPTAGPRGNIRDSSPFVTAYDASPIYNWLCRDEWTVA